MARQRTTFPKIEPGKAKGGGKNDQAVEWGDRTESRGASTEPCGRTLLCDHSE